jgi:hypothetical protein
MSQTFAKSAAQNFYWHSDIVPSNLLLKGALAERF